MKALVGIFNKERALVGAFSVIVKIDRSLAALISTLNGVRCRTYLLKISPVLGSSNHHHRRVSDDPLWSLNLVMMAPR